MQSLLVKTIVRRALEQDISSIAELFIQIFPNGCTEEVEGFYRKLLVYDESEVWVLVINEQIIGVMDIISYHRPIHPCHVGNVQYLFILPQYVQETWKLIRKGFEYCKRFHLQAFFITTSVADASKWVHKHRYIVDQVVLKGPYTWVVLTQ